MQSLWMVAASLLFACMGVCVKLGSARFSAAELVFSRGAIALLLIYAYVRLAGLSLATPHWRTHLIRGLAGFISLVMYFYAISMIPLATAVTLNYTSPLFLALLLAFWLKERIRPLLFVALAMGFVGVILLLRPSWSSGQIAGGLFGLGSGVIASVAYLNVRKLGELGEPEWRTVFYFSLIAAIGGLPWVLWGLAGAGQLLPAIDARGWLLLLGVGGFGALAQLCMTRAYKHGKTMVSASLAYSTVVFSSLFGMWLWGETLPIVALMGMGLILASGIFATALSHAAPVEQD
ncbi:MAG: DMT family transporter [Proteobacteria bacterium]|nr:DMT family transporter [Pseudomonadota bacterium]